MASHRKIGKKSRKIGKWPRNPIVEPFFLFFGYFSLFSGGRPFSIFFLFFHRFRAGGPKPTFCSWPVGSQVSPVIGDIRERDSGECRGPSPELWWMWEGYRWGGVKQGRFVIWRFPLVCIGADSWEVDLDSSFSIFGVRRFTEWPGPLHWIAFPVEILTKRLIHWIPPPFSLKTPFFSLKSASSDPLTKNRLLAVFERNFRREEHKLSLASA